MHGHAHDHQLPEPGAAPSWNRAFAIGVVLNLVFVVVELVFGIVAGSLALIADAGHNFSDVLSLLLAWGAAILAGRQATDRRTYGFRKATVLAPLASALLLLLALGSIAWEALQRLSDPQPVAGSVVMLVAGIGVVINTATALLFLRGRRTDINIRAAFLHMAADAAISLGVVVAGAAILWTGWLWLDPLVSLSIVLVVVVGTWGLVRDAANYAIDAVPAGIDTAEVRDWLGGLSGVTDVHHLHIWPLSATEIALTAHLVVDSSYLDNDFLATTQQALQHRFGIGHATLQLEAGEAAPGCQPGEPALHCIKTQ